MVIQPGDRDQDTAPQQQLFAWAVFVLMLGGVLTVAWIGFLLWLAFQLGSWGLSLI
jgi:hypothetical protein